MLVGLVLIVRSVEGWTFLLSTNHRISLMPMLFVCCCLCLPLATLGQRDSAGAARLLVLVTNDNGRSPHDHIITPDNDTPNANGRMDYWGLNFGPGSEAHDLCR